MKCERHIKASRCVILICMHLPLEVRNYSYFFIRDINSYRVYQTKWISSWEILMSNLDECDPTKSSQDIEITSFLCKNLEKISQKNICHSPLPRLITHQVWLPVVGTDTLIYTPPEVVLAPPPPLPDVSLTRFGCQLSAEIYLSIHHQKSSSSHPPPPPSQTCHSPGLAASCRHRYTYLYTTRSRPRFLPSRRTQSTPPPPWPRQPHSE